MAQDILSQQMSSRRYRYIRNQPDLSALTFLPKTSVDDFNGLSFIWHVLYSDRESSLSSSLRLHLKCAVLACSELIYRAVPYLSAVSARGLEARRSTMVSLDFQQLVQMAIPACDLKCRISRISIPSLLASFQPQVLVKPISSPSNLYRLCALSRFMRMLCSLHI
ncbi:hypothetical protein WMY93_006031 [Mugilogobius chulae]|uniref:Uncharacterized protein n=1 Tax=Mugilogobius chulae TaxID=88201 RepID=A0AAW0PUX2_9GOBI